MTTYVATVGALSSVTIVSFMEVAGGMAEVYSFTDRLATTLFVISVFGFMGNLPLLLSPFTRWGAGFVLLLEAVLLAT